MAPSLVVQEAVREPMTIDELVSIAKVRITPSRLGVIVVTPYGGVTVKWGSLQSELRIFLVFPHKYTNLGHYVCTISRPMEGLTLFFNPYGGSGCLSIIKPFIPAHHRISVSGTAFERRSAKVNTCGPWTIVRLMYSDLTDAEFAHRMRTKADSDIVKLILTPVDNSESKVEGGSEKVRAPIRAVPPSHHSERMKRDTPYLDQVSP